MQSPYEWISIVIQAGILAVLIYIAWHIRQVNAKTGVSFSIGGRHHSQLLKIHHGLPTVSHSTHKGTVVHLGISYSIWVFRGRSWELLKPCGQPGCSCGAAPTAPGQYEGQVIRRECPGD